MLCGVVSPSVSAVEFLPTLHQVEGNPEGFFKTLHLVS